MIAGITGHQNLIDPLTKQWVKKELLKSIKIYKPTAGISALAVGADQLFAECLIEQNIPFQAIIPCHQYEETFSIDNLKQYRLLKEKAEKVVILNHNKPSEKAFWEAGKYIADRVDILFVVWNGNPSKGWGGTADIVNYALEKQDKNLRILHLNITSKETHLISI